MSEQPRQPGPLFVEEAKVTLFQGDKEVLALGVKPSGLTPEEMSSQIVNAVRDFTLDQKQRLNPPPESKP